MADAPQAIGAGRRRFLKLLGLLGLSSAFADRVLPGAVAASPATPQPAAPADTASSRKREISEDAYALAGIVRRRHGKHLDARQLDAVAEELDNRVQAGRALRGVKLGNHEEPDFTFRA